MEHTRRHVSSKPTIRADESLCPTPTAKRSSASTSWRSGGQTIKWDDPCADVAFEGYTEEVPWASLTLGSIPSTESQVFPSLFFSRAGPNLDPMAVGQSLQAAPQNRQIQFHSVQVERSLLAPGLRTISEVDQNGTDTIPKTESELGFTFIEILNRFDVGRLDPFKRRDGASGLPRIVHIDLDLRVLFEAFLPIIL